MKPFTTLTAVTALVDRVNVDTDAIIPKQFLRRIERTGFGKHLFHDWRYLDDAGTQPNPQFELNAPRYQGARILVTRHNFGCGSSREHAPWALMDYGFRAIVAPSFADIFYNNCFKNGILPVVLKEDEVQALFDEVEAISGTQLTVNLEAQEVSTPNGLKFSFGVEAFPKRKLLQGLDDIGWSLQYEQSIDAFESRQQQDAPWMVISA